jgi:hypothetical protein
MNGSLKRGDVEARRSPEFGSLVRRGCGPWGLSLPQFGNRKMPTLVWQSSPGGSGSVWSGPLAAQVSLLGIGFYSSSLLRLFFFALFFFRLLREDHDSRARIRRGASSVTSRGPRSAARRPIPGGFPNMIRRPAGTQGTGAASFPFVLFAFVLFSFAEGGPRLRSTDAMGGELGRAEVRDRQHAARSPADSRT